MLISEFIKVLEQAKKYHGDVEVKIWDGTHSNFKGDANLIDIDDNESWEFEEDEDYIVINGSISE